jgi:putative membrane protein
VIWWRLIVKNTVTNIIELNRQFSKIQIATAVTVLFHSIGLFGILIFKSDFIIRSTPVNMLLSFTLLVWTQAEKNSAFWLFVFACVSVGIAVEIIGVNTGLLFGSYNYGDVLGIKFKAVPLLIGINWFIIIYCCGISIQGLLLRMLKPIEGTTVTPSKALKSLAVITDGATLAVLFDWLMEPVAVILGFWHWQDNVVPLYNYVCWFAVSALLLLIFNQCRFNRQNKFATHLLLIQTMFFLILRTFLQ